MFSFAVIVVAIDTTINVSFCGYYCCSYCPFLSLPPWYITVASTLNFTEFSTLYFSRTKNVAPASPLKEIYASLFFGETPSSLPVSSHHKPMTNDSLSLSSRPPPSFCYYIPTVSFPHNRRQKCVKVLESNRPSPPTSPLPTYLEKQYVSSFTHRCCCVRCMQTHINIELNEGRGGKEGFSKSESS